MPLRDINEALADRDDDLLAIPGVAGVYVVLLSDGTTSLERRIPRTLDGHSVVTEVTGEIRPLRVPSADDARSDGKGGGGGIGAG